MKHTAYRKNSAFTLIELLVVIVVVAILLSMLVPLIGACRARLGAWHHSGSSSTTSAGWTCDRPDGCGSRP